MQRNIRKLLKAAEQPSQDSAPSNDAESKEATATLQFSNILMDRNGTYLAVSSNNQARQTSLISDLGRCNGFAPVVNPQGLNPSTVLAMGSCLPVFDPMTNSSVATLGQLNSVNNQTIPADSMICINGEFQQDCPQPNTVHGGPDKLNTYINIGASGFILLLAFLFIARMCRSSYREHKGFGYTEDQNGFFGGRKSNNDNDSDDDVGHHSKAGNNSYVPPKNQNRHGESELAQTPTGLGSSTATKGLRQ